MVEVGDAMESHAWSIDDDLVVELTIPTVGRVSEWAYRGVILDAELALDFLCTVGMYSAGMLGGPRTLSTTEPRESAAFDYSLRKR